MYSSLLVPIDGSPASARAITVAASLARRTQATVHVVFVNDPSAYIPFVPGEIAVPVYDADLIREQREASAQILQREVAALEHQGIRAVGTLLDGTVVEALLEHGQQMATELTIMTTHGRGGFTRLRLGSVATSYLTRATTPVLLLHHHDHAYGTEAAPAGTDPAGTDAAGTDAAATPPAATDLATLLPTAPLLCPVDGSGFSEAVLPHAVQFAEACGIGMALFSVVLPHPVPMAPFGADVLLADPAFLEQDERDRAAELTRLAATCPAGTTIHQVTDMSAGRAILDEAARIGAGAISMATHGRGGIARAVLGSVADEVIRHAHVPILVIHPADASDRPK
ncbi:MAG: universal stress protein [Gemmatimonadaceae bacterium]